MTRGIQFRFAYDRCQCLGRLDAVCKIYCEYLSDASSQGNAFEELMESEGGKHRFYSAGAI